MPEPIPEAEAEADAEADAAAGGGAGPNRFSQMLYYFLMDDVARKQPKKQDMKTDEVELTDRAGGEKGNGQMVSNMDKKAVLRTLSAKTPKKGRVPRFPSKKALVIEMEGEGESPLTSPAVPAFAATRDTKDQVRRGDNRLTM